MRQLTFGTAIQRMKPNVIGAFLCLYQNDTLPVWRVQILRRWEFRYLPEYLSRTAIRRDRLDDLMEFGGCNADAVGDK